MYLILSIQISYGEQNLVVSEINWYHTYNVHKYMYSQTHKRTPFFLWFSYHLIATQPPRGRG